MVVVVDVTVLHVAAPAISADLSPTAIQLLWIIDVYPLVAAPLLLASGVAGDRLGRRKVLFWGLAVFGIASVAAAFAPSAPALIAARALLGVGGALIMPATMSIIRDAFRDRDERVRAVGIWSAVSAGGAALGPLLGGFLVEHFWWGSVFLINVPILIIVVPFAIKVLPESRAEEPPPWNTSAVVLAGESASSAGLRLQGGRAPRILRAHRPGRVDPRRHLPLGFRSRTAEERRPDPQRAPLRRREFAVAIACVFMTMFGLVGIEFFGAQYLALVLGLSPLEAALRLLPLMISTLAGGLLAARVLKRLGTRQTIAIGLAATALGLVPMLLLGVSTGCSGRRSW